MTDKQIFVNVIDGQERPSATGDVLDIVNPATGEVYATSPNSGDEDVDAAFAAAARAFETQRWTTPSERQGLLLRFADLVESSATELAEIECENTGKPLGLTLSRRVAVLVDQLRFFAGAARVLEGRGVGGVPAGLHLLGASRATRAGRPGDPVELPAMMAIWKLAPALAAGNTAVLKAVRHDARDRRSGWPARRRRCSRPAVVNVVCGDRDTGARLAAHPVPRMVSITGSTRAGVAVARAAAADLKVGHLELGGKAPVVVFDDADLESAVEGSPDGRPSFNAGQDCTAATRVICQSGVYDDFVAALARAAEGTRTGFDPADEDLFLRPDQQRPAARDDLGAGRPGGRPRAGRHRRAPAGGARLLLRPHRDRRRRAGRRGRGHRDLRAGHHRAAVRRRGRGRPVRQRHPVRARLLGVDHRRGAGGPGAGAARLRCVWVNTHIPLVAEMPHGGFKHSGYGKDLSMYSLEDYTR